MRFLNNHMHWIFLSGTRTLMIGPNETTSTPGDTMKENLMRLPEVMKRTGFGRSQIYRLVNQKEFPNQIRRVSKDLSGDMGEGVVGED